MLQRIDENELALLLTLNNFQLKRAGVLFGVADCTTRVSSLPHSLHKFRGIQEFDFTEGLLRAARRKL